MPYIYRYIDIENEEVVYIGKVQGVNDMWNNPLKKRHNQHKHDEWYKQIGNKNLIMQYIELNNHADADILETWLISKYANTGQLKNKAKTRWGESNLELSDEVFGKWKTYGKNIALTENAIKSEMLPLIQTLIANSEGLEINITSALNTFNEKVIEISEDIKKSHKFSKIESFETFKRSIKTED